jgi:hypothetical protein
VRRSYPCRRPRDAFFFFFFFLAIYSSPEKRRCSEQKRQNCDTQVRGSLCRVCDVRCHQTNNSGLFFSTLQSMDTNVRATPKQQQSMQASDAHAPIAADCVPLSRACRRSAETRAAVQPVVYDEDNAHAQYPTLSPKLRQPEKRTFFSNLRSSAAIQTSGTVHAHPKYTAEHNCRLRNPLRETKKHSKNANQQKRKKKKPDLPKRSWLYFCCEESVEAETLHLRCSALSRLVGRSSPSCAPQFWKKVDILRPAAVADDLPIFGTATSLAVVLHLQRRSGQDGGHVGS